MAYAREEGFLQNVGNPSASWQMSDEELAYYSEIDKATRSWLNTLQHIWGLWKKSKAVTITLHEYFETAPNPYLSTLRILVNVIDFHHGKTKVSLSCTVVEEFTKWIERRRQMYAACIADVNLKIAAFRLVTTQKNFQLVKNVAVVYEFIKDKNVFLEIIQDMLKDRKYKEVAQLAEMLKLQPLFKDPTVLMVPLILQNKMAVVEDFLVNQPELQKTLVTYLDNLLAPDKIMHVELDQLISDKQIPDIKISTAQVKPMTKLIARLVKLYNLPQEICPYLNQKRGEGALQFLIYKRYVDASLSIESWREMAKEAVGIDTRLQSDIVKLLVQANDTAEALYFAKTFNVPKSQWPFQVINLEERTANNDDQAEGYFNNWENDESGISYHTFNLPRECIKIINDARSFEEFLDEGLKGYNVVGIDSEWKPSFGTKKTEVALIQIAVETNVYILDVTTLGNDVQHLWAELALTLFENRNVIKLGFGIAHDIAAIRDSLPALANIRGYGEGYLDLVHLWRKLIQEENFSFPHHGDDTFTNESLSKLVELTLGNRLNKSDQFSNWERRPLRESQLIYASLDAYCLLEVYDVLAVQCARLDIPFEDICNQVQHKSHKSDKKALKKSSTKVQIPANLKSVPINHWQNPVRQPIPAHEWRVVCDSMLGGLARQLRMCGCNCVLKQFDRGGGQSAKVAINENRVLLTRNGTSHKFEQHLPPGYCYRISAHRPEQQLKEVLNHFGIVVKQRDIFSRCQICNQDEFVLVPKMMLAELVRCFTNLRHESYHSRPGTSSYDFDVDNADYYESSSYKNGPNGRSKQDRTWHLNANTVDMSSCTTRHRVRIQIEKVPPSVLRNVNYFYVCESCGKVYWDGSHIERALNGVLKDVIVQD